MVYSSFPSLTKGVPYASLKDLDIINNTYPRLFFTGHPGYVVRPGDSDSKHALLVGPGNPIVGQAVLTMANDKFISNITSRLLKRKISRSDALISAIERESQMMLCDDLQSLPKDQDMLPQYGFTNKKPIHDYTRFRMRKRL